MKKNQTTSKTINTKLLYIILGLIIIAEVIAFVLIVTHKNATPKEQGLPALPITLSASPFEFRYTSNDITFDMNGESVSRSAVTVHDCFMSFESFQRMFPDTSETDWNEFKTQLTEDATRMFRSIPTYVQTASQTASKFYSLNVDSFGTSIGLYTITGQIASSALKALAEPYKSGDTTDIALPAVVEYSGVQHAALLYAHGDETSMFVDVYFGNDSVGTLNEPIRVFVLEPTNVNNALVYFDVPASDISVSPYEYHMYQIYQKAQR